MVCNFKIKTIDEKGNNVEFIIPNTGTNNEYASFRKSLIDFTKSNESETKDLIRLLHTSEVIPDVNVIPNQTLGLFSSGDLINSFGQYTEERKLLETLPIKDSKNKNVILGYASATVPTGLTESGQLFVNLNYDYDKANKIRGLFELALYDNYSKSEYELLINKMKTSSNANERTIIINDLIGKTKYKEQLTSLILNAYSNIDINTIFESQEISVDPNKLSVMDALDAYSNLDKNLNYEPQKNSNIYTLAQGDLIGIPIPGSDKLHFEIFYDLVRRDNGYAVKTLNKGELFQRTIKNSSVVTRKFTSEKSVKIINNIHGDIDLTTKIVKGHKLVESDLYSLIKLGLISSASEKLDKNLIQSIIPEKLEGSVLNSTLPLKNITHFKLLIPTELSTNVTNTKNYSKLAFVRVGDIVLMKQDDIYFNALIIGEYFKEGISNYYYVKAKEDKNGNKIYVAGSTKYVEGVLNIGKGISQEEIVKVDETINYFENKRENKTHFKDTPYSYSDGYPEMLINVGDILIQNGIKHRVAGVGKMIRIEINDANNNIKMVDIPRENLSKYKVVGNLVINNTFANQNIWKNRYFVSDKELLNSESIPCKVGINETTKFTMVIPINQSFPSDLKDITDIYKEYLEKKYKTKLELPLRMFKRGNYGVKNFADTVPFKYRGETGFTDYIIPGAYIQLRGDVNSYIVERITRDGNFVIAQYGFGSSPNPNTNNPDLKYIKMYRKILSKDLENVVEIFMPNWATKNIEKLNELIVKPPVKASYELNQLSDNDSPEIIFNMTKLISDKFGVNVNIIGNDDLDNFPELGENKHRIRAFTSNGEIYINIDKASIEEPLHELLHLVLGTMKAQDPDNYYNIVSSIQGHPLFHEISKLYEEVNADVLEETFIRLLTKTFRKNIESEGIFNEVIFDNALKSGISELMDLQEDISEENPIELLNTKVADILFDFGSSIIENKEGIINKDDSVMMLEVSSTLRNLLKTKNLVQTC